MLQVETSARARVPGIGNGQGILLLPPFTLRAQVGLRPLYDLVGSGIQYPINVIYPAILYKVAA
jgi:hypothetical protein